VLLQLPLAPLPARFDLGQDPRAAALHLHLGEAGAAAQRVIGEPLGQALLPGDKLLDLPTVRSVSRPR
jgi:hypothetical protein